MSNLFKASWVTVKQEEKRVIDSNSLMAQKMERFSENNKIPGPSIEHDSDLGFSGGLEAVQVDALLADEGESGIIKVDAEAQANELLEQAQIELEQARFQAEQMKRDAQADIEVMKRVAGEEARSQGYAEGFDKGMTEVDKLKRECEESRRRLQMEYEQKIDELEPLFVETLTGIYEQVFQLDLKSHGAVVTHLINCTMRNIDDSRDFIVHVSVADYEYVKEQKEVIRGNITSARSSLEIVEDMILSQGDCIIETVGGVFDCGLGTQLSGLNQKLRLLSFER